MFCEYATVLVNCSCLNIIDCWIKYCENSFSSARTKEMPAMWHSIIGRYATLSNIVLFCLVLLHHSMMAVLHQHGHGGHGHSHGNRNRDGQGHGHGSSGEANKKGKGLKNINVHAAFIHVVGDLIQSIGIVIAGYIIWFKVSYPLTQHMYVYVSNWFVTFETVGLFQNWSVQKQADQFQNRLCKVIQMCA